MYTDTITVFNKLSVKKQVFWYPTVIRNVELQITAGRNRNSTGLENADSSKVFICYTGSNGKIMVKTSDEQEKEYQKPKAWKRCTGKNQVFTFQEGIDFFIQGEYPEEVIEESEYEDGFFNYMTEQYDDIFLVNKVDVYKTIPHLEIGGK